MYMVITWSVLLRIFCIEAVIDYFDPKFDQNKNCEHEELMLQLKRDPLRCSHASKGSDAVQWEECKKSLSRNLAETCPNTKIERVRNHQINKSTQYFYKIKFRPGLFSTANKEG